MFDRCCPKRGVFLFYGYLFCDFGVTFFWWEMDMALINALFGYINWSSLSKRGLRQGYSYQLFKIVVMELLMKIVWCWNSPI